VVASKRRHDEAVTSTAPADVFQSHRDHLTSVAYRMLGSLTDAQDAVQETWFRWDGVDQSSVADARAWLTTVTARICLDHLRSARVRREAYVGHWLPEPLVERLPATGNDPADRVTRADEVSYALLVVLERLSPEQRVAFVLHDVFGVPYDEIATVLSTNAVAARKLGSRARRALAAEGGPRHTADLAEQRKVVEAFLAAARSGDIDGLLAVLAPDAVAFGDGGGVAPAGRRPVVGASQVARFIAGLFRRYQRGTVQIVAEPVLVNGALGLSAEVRLPDGATLRSIMTFAIAEGRVTRVFNLLNPGKLRHVPPPAQEYGLPALDD
jgi:RNA polymerase sigma-70 factor, ECF subfamily